MPSEHNGVALDQPLRDARDQFERVYFEYHLARESYSMTRVADRAGLERTHLYRKLKQLGIELSRGSAPQRSRVGRSPERTRDAGGAQRASGLFQPAATSTTIESVRLVISTRLGGTPLGLRWPKCYRFRVTNKR